MTKITTPEALLSYEHLFEPTSPEGSGAEPQYSACLVFNKETDLSDLKKAVEDTGRAKWGEKYDSLKESGSLRLPFRTDRLKEKGYQFIGDEPTPGAHGSRVIFIHPKRQIKF